MNVASREPRSVPFSWFYSALLRDAFAGAQADHKPESGHEYSARVATVVILAAFVTEAAINEIAYWLEGHFTQPVKMPEGFERFSVWKKWKTVPQECGAKGFDETQRPWEDFAALIELRNALAHAAAYPHPPEPVLLVLEARGCTQKATDWFESVMTLRTARWANETAAAMPEALRQMLAPHIDLQNKGFSWSWGPEWLRTVY